MMNPADIVFSDANLILAALIKPHGEPFGHVSLATGNGLEVIGAEATITVRELHPWERVKYVAVRYPGLPSEKAQAIIERGLSMKGEAIYDFWQLIGFSVNVDVHTEGLWVCSSLICHLYEQEGVQLLQRTKAWEARPQHLYRTASLVTVESVGIRG